VEVFPCAVRHANGVAQAMITSIAPFKGEQEVLSESQGAHHITRTYLGATTGFWDITSTI
jgi:hypothetical protein